MNREILVQVGLSDELISAIETVEAQLDDLGINNDVESIPITNASNFLEVFEMNTYGSSSLTLLR